MLKVAKSLTVSHGHVVIVPYPYLTANASWICNPGDRLMTVLYFCLFCCRCSLTHNFDRDRQWGFCATEETQPEGYFTKEVHSISSLNCVVYLLTVFFLVDVLQLLSTRHAESQIHVR